jgi:hypothetical protein
MSVSSTHSRAITIEQTQHGFARGQYRRLGDQSRSGPRLRQGLAQALKDGCHRRPNPG